MKATLQIRQKQQLAMTPQLQQAIHLLQLSTQELEQEIGRAVAQNPFLERVDPPRHDTISLHADGSTRAGATYGEHTDYGERADYGERSERGGSTGPRAGHDDAHDGYTGISITGAGETYGGSNGFRDAGSPGGEGHYDGESAHHSESASRSETAYDSETTYDSEAAYDSASAYGARESVGDEGWGFDTPGPRPDGSDQDESFRHALASEVSLQTHLLDQLAETRCTPRQRALTELLIWELRDDGYFSPDFVLDELMASLQARASAPGPLPGDDTTPAATLSLQQDLETALEILQGLDPAGVGARSPGECLRLQLLRLAEASHPAPGAPAHTPQGASIPPHTPAPAASAASPGPATPDILPLALQLVSDDCLPLLADQKDDLLCRRLRCTPALLRAARLLIRSLDPHPGNRFGSEPAGYIIPDLTVRHTPRGWRAELTTSAMPRLRVHDEYESLLKNHQPAEKSAAQNPKSGAEWVQRVTEDSHDETASTTTGPAASGLLQQLQEARSLARQVQQRGQTILQVAQAIIDRQKPFFSQGPEALRPLVLRDIAEAIGRHETTVSRATSHKYIRTPFGIFELKYFFSSQVATDSGGLTASNAIRAQIQKLIEQENPHQPLTDADITEMLGQRGIQVARRTVAKYRESLNILPASQRRRR